VAHTLSSMYAPHALAAKWLGGAYIKSNVCATHEILTHEQSLIVD
jgi:hypothetical protein